VFRTIGGISATVTKATQNRPYCPSRITPQFGKREGGWLSHLVVEKTPKTKLGILSMTSYSGEQQNEQDKVFHECDGDRSLGLFRMKNEAGLCGWAPDRSRLNDQPQRKEYGSDS